MKFKVYSCVTVSDITDNSIASVDVMYYLSTSNTECIGGTWSTTPPPWENGKYYWQKTVTTFTDTSIQPSETQPVCITGGKGQDGRGVQSITEEYYLSTSKEEPIGGEWTTTQPQWTKGKYIWTRSKIVYTNPTGTEYTEAYCDSSWEVIDKIEIGGKNLLLNTSSMIEYDEEICNWSLDNNGQVSINETDAATDSRHIKTSNASDANSGLKSVITGIDFKQGENYTFSCAIRGTCDESRLFGCQIYYRNEDGISTYDPDSRTLWTDNGDDINDGISASNFQRRYCTFTIPDDYDENTNLLAINIYCTTMDIYVRNFQLERGNVATDWKMSDEDIQSQIQSVTSTISGVSSKVNQIEQNITDKVWITDINDYINDYDQSTVQVISDKLTEQIQDVDGIKSTVSSMQTTLETKADGSTVTELTNRVSQAQQDITGFKQTVEETYATKDENNSVRTYAEQLADKFNWVVTSNSSSTSLTLTDNMVSAITDQFVIKSPDGKRVVIEDGILKSDFLQSLNYQAGTGTPKYASAGTMFDMTNGAIYSKNFVISSSGEAYFKGTVYASSGKFVGDIVANSLTLGEDVSIEAEKILGLSDVATSGNYESLNNKPDLTIYFQKDHTLGTVSDGSTGINISSSGLLQASNAVIYGTIYASAGSFAGHVEAHSGQIGDCTIVDGKLTVPFANITGQLTSTQISAGAITSDKITSGAVTADKINVNDLSALGATIGGFHINTISIYSGSKGYIDSTSTGIYMDKNGQMSIGDGDNYIKYYKDENNQYHLAISADELVMSTGTKLEVFLGQLTQSIDDAATKATNFLKFDSNGVVIGDYTKSTLGKNVLIDSDSVDIRDGSTVLATFAANQIDLGKNSSNSIIKLCNGLGQITSAEETYGQALNITSEWLSLSSKRTVIDSENDRSHFEVADDGIYLMYNINSSSTEMSMTPEHARWSVWGSTLRTPNYIDMGGTNMEINYGIPSNSVLGNVQLRLSGGTGSQSLSFVGYDIMDVATYFNSVMTDDGKMSASQGFMCGSTTETFQNQVLWSGAVWPTGEQSCTLMYPITEMPHGVLIIFSNYSGSIQNTRIHCFYVPKKAISQWSGSGFQFNMFSTDFSQVCGKYLYIANSKITGHNDNTKTGTASSGIKYANNTFALRAVVGV